MSVPTSYFVDMMWCWYSQFLPSLTGLGRGVRRPSPTQITIFKISWMHYEDDNVLIWSLCLCPTSNFFPMWEWYKHAVWDTLEMFVLMYYHKFKLYQHLHTLILQHRAASDVHKNLIGRFQCTMAFNLEVTSCEMHCYTSIHCTGYSEWYSKFQIITFTSHFHV